MLCPQCGASIDDSSRFCQSCGTGTAIGVRKTAEVSSSATGAVPPTEAPPTPVSAPASTPTPRRPVYALVGGVIVAGIVAAAVIVYMHTKSAPATPPTAAASDAPAAANASADEY